MHRRRHRLFREEIAIYVDVNTAQQKPGSRDQLYPCSQVSSADPGRWRELFDASSEAKAGTKLRWLLCLPQQMILSHLKCLFQLIYVANSLALVLLYGLLQIQLQTLFLATVGIVLSLISCSSGFCFVLLAAQDVLVLSHSISSASWPCYLCVEHFWCSKDTKRF